MANWGSSRGNQLGYKIFIVLLKTAGVFPAYALLRLVTLYYFFFPGKAAKPLLYYFQKRLGYSSIKARLSIYENFNYLGRSIIDKIVMMSPMPNPYTVNHEGKKYLDDMSWFMRLFKFTRPFEDAIRKMAAERKEINDGFQILQGKDLLNLKH